MKRVFCSYISYAAVLLCGIGCALRVSAQLNSSTSFPMLTTPPPKATMMDRFGSYPVSFYTGLVDITIPIFTIETNGITVPIEFKYHASGLKYDDLPMELGYGWTLIAGGTVSYSARGAADMSPPSGIRRDPFIKPVNEIIRNDANEGNLDAHQNWIGYVAAGSKPNQTTSSDYFSDSEYDVFSYSFHNYSGQYYTLSGEESIQVPANALQISAGASSNVIIKDDKGITYSFDMMEWDFYSRNAVYYLKRIISADEADTVMFQYRTFGTGGTNSVRRPVIDRTYNVVERDPATRRGFRETTFEYGGTAGITYKSYYPPLLTSIQYRGGTVEFTYQNQTTSRSLKEIKIISSAGTPVRSVSLIKPRTDWLDEVEFRDQSNGKVYSYILGYNGTVSGLQGIDYWGYYNGATLNTSGGYVPNFTIPIFSINGTSLTDPHQIPGMDRTPNQTYMQRGILNKITYPTKGYSLFSYEPHKSGGKTYGGLRIREIQNFDESGTLVEKKWYRYGTNESGEGRAAYPIANTSDVFFSDDFCNYSMVVNSIIGNGSHSANPGDILRIRQYYAFPKLAYFTSGSSVVYPEVTEYSGTGTVSNGKTVYKFSDAAEERMPTSRSYRPDIAFRSYSWRNGQLLSKTSYNSNNQAVHTLTNAYTVINGKERLNLRVLDYADIVGVEAEKIKKNFSWYPYPGAIETFSGMIGGSLYDYFNYYINTGLSVLASSAESADGVTKRTYYSGYNQYGQPNEVRLVDSKGADVLTKYKYPSDFGTVEPYKTMVTKRILAPVLEEAQYLNTTFLYKQFTEYKKWGNRLFAPEYIKQQYGQATPETRLRYLEYGQHGNPIAITKDGGSNAVYLWSYKEQYPVAEVKNATKADVAYAGFESDGKGNWSYSGNTAADATAPTGRRAYNLGGGSLQKTGLVTSRKYLLTYWAKSASATGISGGTAVAVRTRNGWTQYRRVVSGVASVSLSGSVAVDDVRLHPLEAQMDTYTYDPLVGMTSHTDASGNVFYYGYDAFGRLSTIRDLEGKVVEDYQYKYRTN
ncbi:RHS repeat domain-containing protein [Parapedobacter koreensis]|uniref:YD repeat-containing protein n=1 Tax=Parapedobacter koreensis TaxID=332977 RepID=A0A1H7UGF5_9SPHI|nr:RHS repeat domain-containing protein [Parapedobacter koreensis]SEL95824.1 YD repeat-containing protein [Parapedobacter koreensis]